MRRLPERSRRDTGGVSVDVERVVDISKVYKAIEVVSLVSF